MNVNFTEILSTFLSASVIVAVIGYLGKLLIESFAEKNLEKFKISLEAIANEHDVKFSRLHEERANVIKNFYTTIVELENYLKGILATLNVMNINVADWNERYVHGFNSNCVILSKLYSPNKIFFSEEFCLKFDEFLNSIFEINHSISNINLKDEKEKTLNHDVIFKFYQEIIKPLKKDLEKEFRIFLGVS
jgi:hypothetical protein